ncbi:hypothetical protein [Aurantiacibacter spongiae]|uniref:Lipoprotein n=1 Tax=Aurantiacibacter spongiae TaxID=2488860 RepID=A0A3N5CQR2_9SPHN|nr:hypothetical protein [Aurantiacibacter spongiae]RPF70746.1 hypothetical protein EG799_03255 [Aurantiacibacter spongiae]
MSQTPFLRHAAKPVRLTSLAVIAGTLALTGCVPPAPEPTPAPTPAPTVARPEAAPVRIPTPSFDNWMDYPATPGDWSYVAEPGQTMAVFGTDRSPEGIALIMACDLATRRVSIGRKGNAAGQVDMTVRTETRDQVLTAGPVQSRAPLLVAQLAASDPLLDAIAFSKGRFALEVTGTDTIYVPAYPEITRVVEDCRDQG